MYGLQKVFIELGLAVRAVWPDFNHYAGAAVLGNLGQLIELTHVAGAGTELPDWDGPLYTADLNQRKRIYLCANCSKEAVLGQDGTPATIEKLKARGCARCGSHVFHRQSGRSS
jgi:hypothetical protein